MSRALLPSLVLFLVSVAACKDKPVESAPATAANLAGEIVVNGDVAKPNPKAANRGGAPATEDVGTAVVAMMEKISAEVTSVDGDCTKMGQKLKALTPEAIAFKRKTKELEIEFEADPAKVRAFNEKFLPRITMAKRWTSAADKCSTDADVERFLATVMNKVEAPPPPGGS